MAPRANPYRKNNIDATLGIARDAAKRLAAQRHSGYRAVDVDLMLDAFLDIDEHLCEGGDYPEDWEIDESDGDEDEDEDDAGDEDEDEDDLIG